MAMEKVVKRPDFLESRGRKFPRKYSIGVASFNVKRIKDVLENPLIDVSVNQSHVTHYLHDAIVVDGKFEWNHADNKKLGGIEKLSVDNQLLAEISQRDKPDMIDIVVHGGPHALKLIDELKRIGPKELNWELLPEK